MNQGLLPRQPLYRLASAVLAMSLLLASGPSLAERRIALVIGNSGYADAPLRNPLNDARDMGSTLESFGFTVTRLEDADQNAMKRGIRNFSKELGEGTVGLFYYAGHGIQVDGENYLMPIGADIETETDVVYDAIPLGRVLDSMGRSGGGLNLVILDACRNNPYTRSLRSSGRGLARASPSTSGTMILYATEPGEVAADGAGRNGVFTGELLKVLEDAPELEVEQLFKQTTNQVYAKTGGKQSPWSEGGIRGNFSFGQEPVVLEPVEPEPIKPEPVAAPQRIEVAELPATSSMESALWSAAQADNTEGSYEWYLQRFPDGVFSGIARGRMLRLRQAREQREAQLAAEQARLLEEQQQRAREQEEADRREALAEQQRVLEEQEQVRAQEEADKQLALAEQTRRLEERQQRARAQEEANKQLALAEQTRRLEEQQQRVQEQEEADRQAALAEQQRRETLERERGKAAKLAEAKAAEKALSLSRNWRRGVQVGLNAAGINVGTPDGLWGAQTLEGIRRWQAANALPETGYLNGSDYRQLVAELNVIEVAPPIVVEPSVREFVPPKPARQVFEPEMVRIEGGRFEMGSTEGDKDEQPVHAVSIRSFDMGKTEVTVRQWREFVDANVYVTDAERNIENQGCYSEIAETGKFDWVAGRSWRDPGFGQGDEHPVVCVSWNDIQDYVDWLNTKTSGGYRLPSESEWEYAVRAGGRSKYHFGFIGSKMCAYGNGSDKSASCKDGYVYTSPVGSFQSNRNGLHDMHGNVWEWTQDCWHDDYKGAPSNGSAWTNGGDCGRRVLRGGSWLDVPNYLRSAIRYRFSTSNRNYYTGFRLSRTLTP